MSIETVKLSSSSSSAPAPAQGMNIKTITTPFFIIGAVATLFLAITEKLPNDMLGSFALIFVLGLLFGELGDKVPFIRNWLGGGPTICVFGPALLIYFGILPESVVGIMKDFMDKTNFFAFFIVILIAGAMFTISRKIIIKATIKFLPTILGGLLVAMILAGIGGAITGFGWKEAIYYLAIPIMGGGVGAGALPLSQIYAGATGIDPTNMLSKVMPAVVLGNVLSILFGVVLNKIGKKKPHLTGNGNIMKIQDNDLIKALEDEKKERSQQPITLNNLGVGFFICMMYYIFGTIISKFLVPSIHTFVWVILLLTLTKAFKLLPERLEVCTIQWSNTWTKNLLYAALVPVGIGYMNIPTLIESISNPAYLLITVLVIVGGALGAGLLGRLLGLYPIEAALAGGLCMANMAQTGDLAVLAAANRMDLLPYSAYSSRIGGSVVLILAGILVSIIGL